MKRSLSYRVPLIVTCSFLAVGLLSSDVHSQIFRGRIFGRRNYQYYGNSQAYNGQTARLFPNQALIAERGGRGGIQSQADLLRLRAIPQEAKELDGTVRGRDLNGRTMVTTRTPNGANRTITAADRNRPQPPAPKEELRYQVNEALMKAETEYWQRRREEAEGDTETQTTATDRSVPAVVVSKKMSRLVSEIFDERSPDVPDYARDMVSYYDHLNR